MAGDRKQYERSLRRWDELHERQAYSAPSELGTMAVMYSLCRMKATEAEHIEEIKTFRDEAHEIEQGIRFLGGHAAVFSGINYQSLGEVLTNPGYSGIVLIGHGDFSSVYGDNERIIDWREIASMATHLKRGSVVQRFCGTYARNASVPFGTFVVSDHRDVIAAPGHVFMPELYENDERLLRSVSPKPRMIYEDIKNFFSDHGE